MSAEIGRNQLVPPVPANAVGGAPSQIAGQLIGRGVHHPDRDSVAGLLDGVAQIVVVRDDHRSVDVPSEHVHQQVGGDVHVGTLLLPVGIRDPDG